MAGGNGHKTKLPAFLGGADVWPALNALMKGRRTEAAIAYVTEAPTFLRSGSRLICDMSEAAVLQGQTNPNVVLQLLRRQVRVHSVGGLHAKLIVSGEVLAIGSANASQNSREGRLVEAVLVLRDARRAADARVFIDQLVAAGQRIDPVTAKRLARLFPKLRGRQGSKNAARRVKETRVWRYPTEPDDWPKSMEAASNAQMSRSKRKSADLLGKSWARMWEIDDGTCARPSVVDRLAVGDSLIEIEDDGNRHWLLPEATIVGMAHDRKSGDTVLHLCRPKGARRRNLAEMRRRVAKDGRKALSTGGGVRQFKAAELAAVRALTPKRG